MGRDSYKDKKVIMYVLGGIMVLLLVGAIIYLVIINKDSKNKDNKIDNDVTNKEDDNKVKEEDKGISYVSCDDNTALLNVRNSSSGDIIDGISCYLEVNVEDTIEGNEACDKWYKISYNKRGNNYTGYACGTYIKNSSTKKSDVIKTRELIDKAISYYSTINSRPYCGTTSDSKEITFKSDDGNTIQGKYVKSEYNSIDDIKKYIETFADSSLFKLDLKVSDINNPKYYDNYYMIDNSLYCRDYVNSGYITNYTGNYDIEITSSSDNGMNVNISYEYLNDNTKCDINNLSKCSNSNFKYEIGKIVIDNGIITKMDFYKQIFLKILKLY